MDRGLQLDDLISELRTMELQKYLERSNRGRSYLRRFFHKLEGDSKFEVEEMKSSIKMNLKDAVSAFYHPNTDSLYLTCVRCSCENFIVRNFLSCKKIRPENIYSLNLKNIHLKKIFPDGIENLPKPRIEKSTDNSELNENVPNESLSHTSPRCFPGDSDPNRATSEHSNIISGEESDNRTSNLIDTGIKRIKVPKVEYQLDCIMSPTEIKNARRMISRGSRTDDDWQVNGFSANQEYYAGRLDLIVNKFNSFKTCEPQNDERSHIMTTMGLNELLKIRLADQDKPYDEILKDFKDRSPNSLPDASFSFMLIGIFSSTGLKKIIETENVFRYERVPTQGHFSCLKYDLNDSSLVYFDTAGTGKICPSRSIYMSYSTISKVMTEFNAAQRRINGLQPRELTISYQENNGQSGLDCGPLTLINLELFRRNIDPASVKIPSQLIEKIRKYHFLVSIGEIKDFRLVLVPNNCD